MLYAHLSVVHLSVATCSVGHFFICVRFYVFKKLTIGNKRLKTLHKHKLFRISSRLLFSFYYKMLR